MTKTGNFFGKFLFCLLFFGALPAFANITVTGTVDSNRVTFGEAVTFSITVETSDSVSVNNPRLPALDGFDVVNSNDGMQSRSTFVNGQFQFLQTYSFNYTLSPIRQGHLTIGSAEVVVGGKSYRTQPITIEVLPAGASGGGGGAARKNIRPQPQQQDPLEEDPFFKDADDLFSQILQRRGLPNPNAIKTAPPNPNEAFFIQLEVDKNEVYEGEQVTASFYLLTPYQIRDIDTMKYPSLRGFWKEDIEIPTRLNFQREVVNGIAYNKALLASYALFPIKAGKISIDSYKAKCTILTQANMLGIGQPYQYTKASQPLSINVKPLPKDNQPADFAGAVGRFNISARLDGAGNKVPVNQPFSLKVKVEGRGNAKVIEMPPLQLPQDLELYETKADSKFFRDGTSYKEFSLLLIPRRQGQFTIPAVTISSFDTEKGKFVQAGTAPISIQVGEGRGGESFQSSPLAVGDKDKSPKAAAKKSNELPPPTLELSSGIFLSGKIQGITWAIVFFGMVLILVLKARSELGLGEREKGVKTKMSDRFKQLNKFLGQNDYRKVGAEGINVTNLVLGDLTKEGGADANFQKLIQKTPPSVRREVEKELTELMSYFESLAFAPEELSKQLAGDMKAKAKALQSVLSKAIGISGKEK